MRETLCVAILAVNLVVQVVSFPSETIESLADLVMVQSPIAINSNNAVVIDDMPPLEFFNHWEDDGNTTLYNAGTTAKVIFRDREEQPFITGGPLKVGESYIFEQMHFHWARKDKKGSEHTVNGQTYSMEVHLVHYNEKYGDLNTAITKKDGLAVVAFFMQAFGDKDEITLKKITDNVPKIQEPGSKCSVDSDCLRWMESHELSRHYYTYHGSLTTPPYNECVTWIIFQAPIFISRSQVDVFQHLRSAKNNKEIGGNSRHVQKVEGIPTVFFVRNSI